MGVAVEIEERLGVPLPRRVAVLRALRLGDLLCAVPALRALRAALPEAEIVLIGLPWARSFVARFGRHVDGFLEFPGYPGLPERAADLARFPAFLAEAQAHRFDLAIQLQGSGTITNPLTVLLGARRNAGFFRPGEYCPDAGRFVMYPDRGPEVRRLVRLMEFLGIPARGEDLEFPLRPEDRTALHDLDEARDLRPGTYACVHPGASAAEKRWPAEHFAAVAAALADRGLRVVLTGTAEEGPLTRAVAGLLRGPHVDLAGRTDLGSLAALVAGARVLVCNDTGVSHVAAALRVPSVVVFRGSDPERWAPLDRRRHRAVGAGIDPGEVIRLVDALLD
ncbi:MAG TPA: glycosyltransferase family 9 protein, partial [Isosphaeraceae bacterium]